MNSRPSRSDLRAKGEEVVAAAVEAVIRTGPEIGGSDMWGELARMRFESIPSHFEQFAARDPELLDIALLNMEDAVLWLQQGRIGNMSEVQNLVADWQGSAALVFRKNFVAPFPGIYSNQYNLAAEVQGALKAQVEIIEASRRDAIAVGDRAIEALNNLERESSGNWIAVALSVIGAVASVAAAIAAAPVTGGGSVVAVGWTLVSAGASVTSAALPSQGGSAGSPEEVIAAMNTALSGVAQATAEEEEILAQALRADVGVFDPKDPSLSLPEVTLGSPGSLGRFQPPLEAQG